jgi:serine/threonine-protein kinase
MKRDGARGAHVTEIQELSWMRFPKSGELFAERYRIERMIASGGFSRIYKAEQTELERTVALKILEPPLMPGSDDEKQQRLERVTARFEREARMLSKLRSPSTITIYEYGRTAQGLLFMAMEHVDGLGLDAFIARHGAISAERVIHVLRQVLTSLYEAHLQQMLHRDLKPANIMIFEHLGEQDQIKLLDFGIVKLVGQESKGERKDITDDDALVGTPRYMAPEYIRGDTFGPACDLYAVGLIAYELLTGKQAIEVEHNVQILAKQLDPAPFYLPEDLDVPTSLRAVVNRLVEKEPAKRYTSAEEVLHDIRLLERQSISSSFNAVDMQALRKLSGEQEVVVAPDPEPESTAQVEQLTTSQEDETRPPDATPTNIAASPSPITHTSNTLWALVFVVMVITAIAIVASKLSGA